MDSVALRQAGAVCETLLLEQFLAPLAADKTGFEGYGVGALAASIAAHDRHGFGALIARQLGGTTDDSVRGR